MTEPDKMDDLELDLDLSLESLDDPATELTPLAASADAGAAADPGAAPMMPEVQPGPPTTFGASAVSEPMPAATFGGAAPSATAGASTAAAAPVATEDGMWVWQYGAPPPPPSFSAVFFGGRGLPELYRFFACGLLVVLGCLLPWGPSLAWTIEQGLPTLGVTDAPGYQLPMGALCLALAVWLMFTACYGIYSGRQKILPVFLMLVPAWASWSRTLDAWDKVGDLGIKLRLEKVFEVAGPGVMLTLVGSTIMALSLLVVILKVLKKKPDDGTGRAPRKGKEKDKDAGKPAEADAKAGKSDAKAGKAGESDDAGKRGRKR